VSYSPESITASSWRQIVQSATDTAIISTDPQGKVTSWNEGARRILGWTETEMLGQSLERLFEDPGQIERELHDAATYGRGGGTEGWRFRKDGSRIWATGEMSPIRNQAGEIAGFVKILRDRTAQRAAEDAAAEERRALEILNRAGSALAAETDLRRLVQIVTDAGVELSKAEFGAFFTTCGMTEGSAIRSILFRARYRSFRQVSHAAQH
jgi:PAS domain S-box-containing protein